MPAPKMRTSADSSQPERASLESCCQPHLPMAGLAQRHRDWSCLLVLTPENSNVDLGSVPCASVSPAPKMRTSGDRAQPERASLESCCSASSAHGRSHTETQRLGLLAYLATSNIKLSFLGSVLGGSAALLSKCAHLQIARSQKELACKAVAQPLLPMALLAQTHRDWGCLLVLPPQTSKVYLGFGAGRPGSPAPKMRTSADSSQPERTSLESCCSASSAHGRARAEAQRLGRLACLATSNLKRNFGGP